MGENYKQHYVIDKRYSLNKGSDELIAAIKKEKPELNSNSQVLALALELLYMQVKGEIIRIPRNHNYIGKEEKEMIKSVLVALGKQEIQSQTKNKT